MTASPGTFSSTTVRPRASGLCCKARWELLTRWVPHRIFAPGTTPAYSNYATSLAGYIVGCEVLWRMSEARVPWETGKYGTVMVLGLVLFPSFLQLGRDISTTQRIRAQTGHLKGVKLAS